MEACSEGTSAGPAFEESRNDPTAYLLPEIEDLSELGAMLEEVWPILFDNELAAWNEDESTWPQERSLAMFREWFGVEFATMILERCEPMVEGNGNVAGEAQADGETDPQT
jgi:hypothetical protein